MSMTAQRRRPDPDARALDEAEGRRRRLVAGVLIGMAVMAGLAVSVLQAGGFAADPRIAILLLAGPIGAGLGALAVTRFEWFVLVVLGIRPSLDFLASGGLGPGALLAAVFVSIAVVWLVALYRSGEGREPSIAAKCLCAFGVAVLISIVTSTLPLVSVASAIEIIAGIAMFLVLEQLLGGRADAARRLVAVVIASSVIPILVGFAQLFGATPVRPLTQFGRIQGTFVHPNPFATYLVMLILLCTALVTVLRGRQRWLLLAYLVVLGAMLIFTYHRGGWIAAIIGIAYIGFRRDRRILALMVAVLVAIVVAVPSVGDRITDLTEEKGYIPEGVPENSLEWRFGYWGRLVPLANESPLTGIGPQVILNTAPERIEPHNVFVQTYVETGVFGIATLLTSIGGIALVLARRRRRVTSDWDTAIAVGSIAVALSVLTQAPTENLLNQTMAWWYLAATTLWGYTGRSSPDRASAASLDESLVV